MFNVIVSVDFMVKKYNLNQKWNKVNYWYERKETLKEQQVLYWIWARGIFTLDICVRGLLVKISRIIDEKQNMHFFHFLKV